MYLRYYIYSAGKFSQVLKLTASSEDQLDYKRTAIFHLPLEMSDGTVPFRNFKVFLPFFLREAGAGWPTRG